MAQRNANVALRDEADTVGRDLWDQATRDGQDLSAPQPAGTALVRRTRRAQAAYRSCSCGSGTHGSSLPKRLGQPVTVKPWAVFTTSLPDDQVEDRLDIVTFGGRNVAAAIREILAGLGCEVSVLDYSGEHGWEFGAKFKDRRVWCVISSYHPRFFLNFDDPPAFGRARRVDPPAYEEIAYKLSAALAEDLRFYDIQWYSRDDPPDPFDGPVAQDLPAGMSSEELFAKGLALEIVEARREQVPLTRRQHLFRIMIGGGLWLGLCSLSAGVVLLTRGDSRGVILLPMGVLMFAMAAVGVVVLLGGSGATVD